MAELRVKGTGTLKLFENDNTSSVTIASPASLGADRTVTLPDASVTLASGTMLATDGDGSSLTGLTPGITGADLWRLTTSFAGSASPIASNLEAADTNSSGAIGSAMTEASGIFTFPSTGIWLITANGEFYYNGDSRYNQMIIEVTTDNSSYSEAAKNSGGIAQSESGTTYNSASTQLILDVTDTANVKVRFNSAAANASSSTGGSSDYNRTHFSFIRLGDT